MNKLLSLCMIVRDEERHIARCLESVKDIADEIVVVDTGSSDATADICRSFGATVLPYEWHDDFAAARNAGIELATGEWILWLDADEELTDVDRQSVRDTLALSKSSLLTLHTIHFYEKTADPFLAYHVAQIRLFRRACGFRFEGTVHETLNVTDLYAPDEREGITGTLPLKLYHYGYMRSDELSAAKHERNTRILNRECERDDANPWPHYHLASEYYRIGSYREAFESVNRSIIRFINKRLMPPSLLYKLKYAVLLETGSAEGAWPSIEKAIELYPDYVDLHFYKGIVLYIMEKYEEANAAFVRCLEIGDGNIRHLTMNGSGSFHAWYYRGQCEEKLGRKSKAEACYRESLMHYPLHKPASEALDRMSGTRNDKRGQWTGRKAGRKMRILTASPVRQKPEILTLFLESLTRLDSGGHHVDFLFVDDNENEASRTLLEAFQAKNIGAAVIRSETEDKQAYQRDEVTHYWNDALVDKVADMKDRILEFALDRQYDAVFLIDSDLLIHPNTLVRLADEEKDIVSNIFWTRWQKDALELPQVWLMDEYSFYRKSRQAPLSDEEANDRAHAFLDQMRVPGVYEVGGLGACTWISRDVMEKGVRFRRLPNVSFWGEDRHFCIRAAALGFRMHVDTRFPAYHIYRESDLPGAIRYLEIHANVRKSAISISLCMIVKNEEESIERCLNAVEGIADEIVVIDTGSTDRTKELVKRFTNKVYDFEWIDDFAAARNFAFSKAGMDYILWLDADDVIEECDRQAFIALKKELDPAADSVLMDYVLMTDGSGTPTVSLKRNRLVKRSKGFRWIGAVHEYLEVNGIIVQSGIAITHKKERAYTDRNLLIYRRRLERGETFSIRDMYYFANELKDHAWFEEAVERYQLFLATKQGWIEDNIAACLKMADCYASLYERDNQLRALFRTFDYDRPRAECCCRLGALFLAENRLQEAVYWYETAAALGAPPQNGAIVDLAAWTWLPHLQLCVCYDKLGQLEKAFGHNEKALACQPNHPSMLYNKKYLEERLGKKAVG
nr:glycosyltransferase [Paenibacillus contaminans]